MQGTDTEPDVPGGPNKAPLNGTRKRQYRGNSQASVWGTDIQRPRIYLEVIPQPDINLDEPVTRSAPVGQLSYTEQPITIGVMTDKGANGPIGPVGHDVMLAGRLEMINRPDPVGPHSGTEQSVFLRLDADQGEHFPTNSVHPGIKMFHTQPVADGPAKSGRRLVARWAGSLILALLNIEKCHPRTIRISR